MKPNTIAYPVLALFIVALLISSSVMAGSADLVDAARNGDLEKVQSLLAKGADVNTKSKYDVTALYIASENGYEPIVKELLAKGADANIQATNSTTALMLAAKNGHTAIVKELLGGGADANIQIKSGDAALHVASEHGHAAIVKELLANGADVNIQKKNGATALYIASQNGHIEVVQELFAKGVDMKVDGVEAFLAASQEGHIAIVRELLANGCDVNAKSRNNVTALHMASGNGHIEIVKLLINKGAVIDARNNYRSTALHWASHAGNIEAVKFLINKGADIYVRNRKGNSPLDLASSALVSRQHQYNSETRKRLIAVIDELIGRGAKFDDKVVKNLIEILNDGLANFEASRALIHIGSPAVPPLIQELEKENVKKETAMRILGEIGDNRAIPILVDTLMEWKEGKSAAHNLKLLKFMPRTTREKVYLLVALRDKDELLKDWEQSREILLEELASKNQKKAMAAIYTLLASGKEDVIPVLVATLKEKGNITIANIFLNSGDARLSSAAEQWGADHGYHITTKYDGSAGAVGWGRF